jgi:predicted amidohydrolase YtcJ
VLVRRLDCVRGWDYVETRMRTATATIVALALLLVACGDEAKPDREPADSVYLGGSVYVGDAARSMAEGVAIRDGLVVAVGDSDSVRAWAGPHTQVVDLAGRMMMPGLQDAHIHGLGIVAGDGCDLDNQPLSLQELSSFVSACGERMPSEDGAILMVTQWNFAEGNRPGGGFSTLREALDAASSERAIMMIGSDGHHGAANSAALALATSADGRRIGLSAQTLAGEFAQYRELVGVDARGEPNGALNEGARKLVNPAALDAMIGSLSPTRLPLVAQRLAESGITSIQDPAVSEHMLGSYRELLQSGAAGFRLVAAVHLDPTEYREGADGPIKTDRMVAEVERLRDSVADVAQLRVAAAKIFVDGVIEGNPLADPPTLPNAAVLRPYLQPIFSHDESAGELQLLGYVDTDSALCQAVRADPVATAGDEAVAAFRAANGFLPAQCIESIGVLEQPEAFVRDYAAALDRAGFVVHSHAIGDRAVRVAVDALEHVRAVNGNSGLPHAITHAQLVHPDDVQRIGRLGVPMVFTFAWAVAGVPYDMSVIPFIDRVDTADGVADLYRDGGYYLPNVYPAASIQAAGGLIVAGSDAPVDTRDPRPFGNIEAAVTRRSAPGQAYNEAEALDIHSAIAAYTRNAARSLQQQDSTGTIEPGKKADLIVLDRNIVDLAERGEAEQISATRVLLTLFEGRVVHRDPALP